MNFDIVTSVRTTLNIDDDALAMTRRHAKERGILPGQTASDLIHREVGSLPRFELKDGWVVFDHPQGALPLTSELVAAAAELDYVEEYQRALQNDIPVWTHGPDAIPVTSELVCDLAEDE